MQKWAQGCKKETPNHSEYHHNDQILAVGEWIIWGGKKVLCRNNVLWSDETKIKRFDPKDQQDKK